jgi:hypothetical protein
VDDQWVEVPVAVCAPVLALGILWLSGEVPVSSRLRPGKQASGFPTVRWAKLGLFGGNVATKGSEGRMEKRRELDLVCSSKEPDAID